MNISIAMMGAVALALVSGAVFGEISWFPFKDLGAIFIGLLKMVMIPLAFVSILLGTMQAGRYSGKLARTALLIMAGMSVAGVALGMLVMSCADASVSVAAGAGIKEAKAPTLLEFIYNCIPVNPFASFANGNMLQIIALAFLIGWGVRAFDETGQAEIITFLDAAQDVCLRVAKAVMYTAPVGVFALLYPVAAKSAAGVLADYFTMAAALLAGSVIYMALICWPLLKFTGLDAREFLKCVIKDDILGAIAGGATNYMAPRLDNLMRNTAIRKSTLDYLIPLLAVLMRAGSCICVGIYTVFAANAYDVTLTPEKILVVLLLTVIALTAAPGIIGGTLMDCAIIWSAVGIPLEAVALLAGIDYVMDLIRTVLNIQGGEVVTAVTDKVS